MARISQENGTMDRRTVEESRAERVAGHMEKETMVLGRQASNKGFPQMERNRDGVATDVALQPAARACSVLD